jgi:NTE family protein
LRALDLLGPSKVSKRIRPVARKTSLVLSGGVALGAYQAGAYEVLHEHEQLRPERLAGSSIGAINAAVIAGNAPEERVRRLREFWGLMAIEPSPLAALWRPWAGTAWRHAYSWLSVLQTRLFGRAGVFRHRLPELMLADATSVYDLAPLRGDLERFINFDRLNGGELRVSVVTTDIETGEQVAFDTHRGDRIGPDHLLASCGFLPDFPPVEIDGRLLGDGGFAANAPVETVLLDEKGDDDLLCFVVDLFCPEGSRPTTLEQAAARRWDLMFGNQSRQRLGALEREYRLRWGLGRLAAELGPDASTHGELASVLAEGVRRTVTLLHLSYRAPAHEAGPEKPFDFSRANLADRWKAGSLDMAEAIRVASDAGARPKAGISVHLIRR